MTALGRTDAKRQEALRLGAHHFAATGRTSVFGELVERFDLILNAVSANLDMDAYLGMLHVDGAMVNVGIPVAPDHDQASSLIFRQRMLAGSNLGG